MLAKAGAIGLKFLLFSTTRKVTERAEYRHVVPGHPPLCDLSALMWKTAPEIKFRFSTRGGNGPIGPFVCPRRPFYYDPLGDQMRDRMNRIRKD